MSGNEKPNNLYYLNRTISHAFQISPSIIPIANSIVIVHCLLFAAANHYTTVLGMMVTPEFEIITAVNCCWCNEDAAGLELDSPTIKLVNVITVFRENVGIVIASSAGTK